LDWCRPGIWARHHTVLPRMPPFHVRMPASRQMSPKEAKTNRRRSRTVSGSESYRRAGFTARVVSKHACGSRDRLILVGWPHLNAVAPQLMGSSGQEETAVAESALPSQSANDEGLSPQRKFDQLHWQRLEPFKKLAEMLLTHLEGSELLSGASAIRSSGSDQRQHQSPPSS
jgi:hypothetical protein